MVYPSCRGKSHGEWFLSPKGSSQRPSVSVASNKSIVLFLSIGCQNILTFDISVLKLMVYLLKIRRKVICPGNQTQGQLITSVGNWSVNRRWAQGLAMCSFSLQIAAISRNLPLGNVPFFTQLKGHSLAFQLLSIVVSEASQTTEDFLTVILQILFLLGRALPFKKSVLWESLFSGVKHTKLSLMWTEHHRCQVPGYSIKVGPWGLLSPRAVCPGWNTACCVPLWFLHLLYKVFYFVCSSSRTFWLRIFNRL